MALAQKKLFRLQMNFILLLMQVRYPNKKLKHSYMLVFIIISCLHGIIFIRGLKQGLKKHFFNSRQIYLMNFVFQSALIFREKAKKEALFIKVFLLEKKTVINVLLPLQQIYTNAE